MLTELFAQLPSDLQHSARQQWEALLEISNASQRDFFNIYIADKKNADALIRLLAASPFCAELCVKHPDWLEDLLDYSLRSPAGSPVAIKHECLSGFRQNDEQLAEITAIENLQDFDKALRDYRNRTMLEIIFSDFNRLVTLQQTTHKLTALADACIEAALQFHYKELTALHGTPRSRDGVAQHMVILGMGKLGAGELNLSSDIDLIYSFPHNGETDGARSLDNVAFFTRLGQRIIKSLDTITADGFVFRVDMRLRPYGQSGPLVYSFGAMEEYYQNQGRDWERYAMIKARVVAGDKIAGAELMQTLKPFVFRRYIDFSVIQSLRSMKALIQQEVGRRQLQDNIKLGSGGIREIEFIAQCMQLIRGGRDSDLQHRDIYTILPNLAKKNYLPQAMVDDLSAAYEFLRNSEHAIQGWRDCQTQELPEFDEPRAALALVMGFADGESFNNALAVHRENVSAHFRDLIAAEDNENSAEKPAVDLAPLWLIDDENDLAEALHGCGFSQPTEAARRILALKNSPVTLRMQAIGRERLDAFMPRLLQQLAHQVAATVTLLRILPLVEAVLRRTTYLVLLSENPGALQQLVTLCRASPWIAEQLTLRPALLDELLDPASLYTVPDRETLAAELRQRLLRIEPQDLEGQMDALRYFRLAHVLKVAASEVTDRLPLMKVSDYLSFIAEVILEQVLELAWQDLIGKHGVPQTADGDVPNKAFVIVAYGKLGGLELGHSSDLDLVFIHDAPIDLATAANEGQRSLDNVQFYARLAQRMIHILTSHTALGSLYEVDTRLRPDGNKGLLVSSLKSFSEYQQHKAWTWEHQALVRARVVAGDGELAQRFDGVREQILAKPRDRQDLADEVIAMRQKMQDHLLPKDLAQQTPPQFHLKQGVGGIVDIEFMVQFAVLADAWQQPALSRWTDNIRILETLAQTGWFAAEESAALIAAYKMLRSHAHRLSLQQLPGVVPLDAVADAVAVVRDSWTRCFSQPR
jgi:glutamate-ammonia-ligase adenylyltransferase